MSMTIASLSHLNFYNNGNNLIQKILFTPISIEFVLQLMQLPLQTAARFIKESHILLIGTGAGMGRDSGLPDFRGKNGFWSSYPPFTNKFNFMHCANPSFLVQHPHLFWGFYGSRLLMYRQKNPHQGYQILRDMASLIAKPQHKQTNYFAFTSNVDGHFQKIGYPQQKILQVHGSIHHLQCYACQKIQKNKFEPIIDTQQMSCKVLPKCSSCGKILRPNILMFKDYEWIADRTEQQEIHYVDFIQKNKDKKIVLLEIGCGMEVATVRNMMERHFYRLKQSKMIRINLDPQTSMVKYFKSERYVDIQLGALEALKKIRDLL